LNFGTYFASKVLLINIFYGVYFGA